jgi:D-alanyl-D-alanine carboxypeptidase
VYTAGLADLATQAPIAADDHTRVASVSKAFSGAAAVALAAGGVLSLNDTIGGRLPALPASWASITLGQLLSHTSGLVDFSQQPAFLDAVRASLTVAPPPIGLLSYVTNQPPSFPPGSRYRYSNTDNIVVGLMVAAAAGQSYEEVLRTRVAAPLMLARTSLPSGAGLPAPRVHGYILDPPNAPEDATELIAAGWSWASGGIVSTPGDTNRFVRGYVSGVLTDAATRAAQFTFIEGGESEPPGPGENAAGLAVFRYRLSCGTVYGHTGNTLGYTQFIAATEDGTRSVTMSVNAQYSPLVNPVRFADLRQIWELAACVALQ